MSNKRTDQDILQAIDRDRNAGFRLLIRSCQEQLYWHIRRIVVVHADAEDVLQETFVRIYRGLDSFKRDSSLRTWMLRIATNEALRHRERHGTDWLPLDSDSGAERVMADEHCDYGDLEAVKLQRAIQSLPPKQQLTFTLRYYDELDYDSIARITDSNPSTAKVNYHLAKEKIIDYLKNND